MAANGGGGAGASAAAQAARKREQAARLLEEARAWEQGAEGEVATGALLRGLAGAGWVILHDLSIPGSTANIDHLLIGPGGVLVLDSKNLHGRIGRGDGTLWCGRRPMRRELAAATRHVHAVARALGLDRPDADTTVANVLVIHGATLPEQWFTINDAIVVAPPMLGWWISQLPARLGPERVADLAARARSALPARHRPTAARPAAPAAPSAPAAPAAPATVRVGRLATVEKRSPRRQRSRGRRRDESLARPLIGLVVIGFIAFTGTGMKLFTSAVNSAGNAGAKVVQRALPTTVPPTAVTPIGAFSCPAPGKGYRLDLTWSGATFLQWQQGGGWTLLAQPGASRAGLDAVKPGEVVSVRTAASLDANAPAKVTPFAAPAAHC